MLEELRSAAKRMGAERTLRSLLADCRRLLSERGDADGMSIARDLVARLDELSDETRDAFFERLAQDFSPDPQAVLRHAQAYAREPNADNLIRLTQAAEPPRQELLRRLNRTPGGTAAIVRLRRRLLAMEPGDLRRLATVRGTRSVSAVRLAALSTVIAVSLPTVGPHVAMAANASAER